MELPQDVIADLKEGRKIEAIKRLRESRRLGLKEAKDAVEDWLEINPEIVPVVGKNTLGSLLPTLVVVAAFGWMFIHLVDVAASIIVLANKGGYERSVFLVGNLRHNSDAKSGLMWGFDGTIDSREERFYAPSLADGETLGFRGLKRLYPPGTPLDVWYNPKVTATLFQGRTLRVLPFAEDLATVEIARLRWWVIWCLVPFVSVAVVTSRIRKRHEPPQGTCGLPPAIGPSSPSG